MNTPCKRILIGATMLFAAVLAGCQKEAEKTLKTSNPEVNVEVVGRFDGCTIYRFMDGESYHFVRCEGAASITTSRYVSCGKGCAREEDVVAQTR